MIIKSVDTKHLQKEIQKWKELAYKDELTGLYNRRGFIEESKKFIKESVFSKKYPRRRKNVFINNFSLVIFDINDFKKINDTYGHQKGDDVLVTFSKIILKRIRGVDLVARWGGDEVVLGLVGASEKDAYIIAEDIRKKAQSSKISFGSKKIGFSVSGGVASFGKEVNFKKIFNVADKALYLAKKNCKNCIIMASKI